MKNILRIAMVTSLISLNGFASDEVHEARVSKMYPSPVSAAQAFTDLEAELQIKLTATCSDKQVNIVDLSFDIPFRVNGGTRFFPNGTPGDTANPVFIHYSYPQVSALALFRCDD